MEGCQVIGYIKAEFLHLLLKVQSVLGSIIIISLKQSVIVIASQVKETIGCAPIDRLFVWAACSESDYQHFNVRDQDISYTYTKMESSPTVYNVSQCMRFPTMWYVRPAKPQISLRIRAVWSEPLLVA